MLLEPFQANELSIQITYTLSPCAAGAIRCVAAACCMLHAACCMLLPRSAAAVAAAVAAADADADAVCPVAAAAAVAYLLSWHTCSPAAAKRFCDLEVVNRHEHGIDDCLTLTEPQVAVVGGPSAAWALQSR